MDWPGPSTASVPKFITDGVDCPKYRCMTSYATPLPQEFLGTVAEALTSYHGTPSSSGRSSPTITETQSTASTAQGDWTTGNTTERSSTDSTYSWDEFDKQAAKTVQFFFDQIDSVLYEQKDGPQHIRKECQEWEAQFPHLRILGKQMLSLQESGYKSIPREGSRPSTGTVGLMDVTDLDISGAQDIQGLTLSGKGISIKRPPVEVGASRSGTDRVFNEYTHLEEEVFAQDGVYEEIIAIEFKDIYEDYTDKKQLTPRRRKFGYPPITPNLSIKDSVISSAFDSLWQEIVECVSLAGTVDTAGIEGKIFFINRSEFSLSEAGDVSWKISDGSEAMPFFCSDTYEVVNRPKMVYLKFFGTLAEHVIEFKVEVSDDLMLLTCERCCLLQCQKVSTDSLKSHKTFSFHQALEEGYFSDLSIKAENGTQFKVHSLICQIVAPDLPWSSIVPPLSGLPEDVLRTVTFYLYNECLPQGLTEKTAKDCIQCVAKMPGLGKFVQLCEIFLKNTALKQQIISLIDDMHSCADRMIDLFKSKKQNVGGLLPDDALAINPPKLCYIIKQAAREGAIACSKLVILCNLFASRSGDLPQEERHEIIKYTRSRLPVFLKQLHELSDTFKFQLSFVNAEQKHEIATYILPEVENILATVTSVVEEFQAALDPAINENLSKSSHASEKPEKKEKKEPVKDLLGKTLRNAIHIRELKLLKQMHEFASSRFEQFIQKKQFFNEKSEAEKIVIIKHVLESLKNREVPMFLERIEELMYVIEDKFKWREWKYLFKLGSSKVAWGVSKLCSYKSVLQPSIKRVVDLVAKEQFTAALVSLGLWSQEQNSERIETCNTSNSSSTTSSNHPKQPQYLQLSAVESLCVPPPPEESILARGAIDLFKRKEKTDMVFEMVLVHDIGDTVIDHTHGEPIERQESDRDVEVYEIPAHRVILASRCKWFSRALQSGMRESIDKKISIHDTNPEVFSLFLEYLYGGQLNVKDLTTDHLSELLSLADRYEVAGLQEVCEMSLKSHIDKETAVYLFSLADQVQSKSLKERVLSYMVENQEVLDEDSFVHLPQHLKSEVEEALAADWSAVLSYMVENQEVLDEDSFVHLPQHLKSEVEEALAADCDNSSSRHNMSDSPSSSSLEDMIHHVSLNARRYSSSSSSSEINVLADQQRLNECVLALREVIGDDVPHDDLVQFVLAADYDISRAINFYFQSS
ncbi:hypothetical protein FSP39_001872 [Pinctada imbricata]|uniref:BTB domain-containing protein n=1 Tax=Pinctada imbricata TaxID=66713 RepID=A0AA88XNG0_PINIB|nr:hypothetical protein FSP39_001872 [Pinctada imbricata]